MGYQNSPAWLEQTARTARKNLQAFYDRAVAAPTFNCRAICMRLSIRPFSFPPATCERIADYIAADRGTLSNTYTTDNQFSFWKEGG